jgi:hypothetical protein
VGETWVLEAINNVTNTTVKLEFRVSGVSQPAQGGNIGPYIITFPRGVTNVEWFEQYSSARYLLFYSYQFNGINYFDLDIDRAFSDRASSCAFRGWKYGDAKFVGTYTSIVESGGRASFVRVGECTLTRKP